MSRDQPGEGASGASREIPSLGVGQRLLEAAVWGSLADADAALATGDAVQEDLDAALAMAAKHGHRDIVERLIATGADVHDSKEAALFNACFDGHSEVVEALLLAGADVSARGGHILSSAAANGDVPTMRLLIAAGADLHVDGNMALWNATKSKSHEAVTVLLDAGALVAPVVDGFLRTDQPALAQWLTQAEATWRAKTLGAALVDVTPADEGLEGAPPHCDDAGVGL